MCRDSRVFYSCQPHHRRRWARRCPRAAVTTATHGYARRVAARSAALDCQAGLDPGRPCCSLCCQPYLVEHLALSIGRLRLALRVSPERHRRSESTRLLPPPPRRCSSSCCIVARVRVSPSTPPTTSGRRSAHRGAGGRADSRRSSAGRAWSGPDTARQRGARRIGARSAVATPMMGNGQPSLPTIQSVNWP